MPSTTSRSANLPTSSVPTFEASWMHSEAVRVEATVASIGVMPIWVRCSSSSALVPCLPTAASVPIAIRTPAWCAARVLLVW